MSKIPEYISVINFYEIYNILVEMVRLEKITSDNVVNIIGCLLITGIVWLMYFIIKYIMKKME